MAKKVVLESAFRQCSELANSATEAERMHEYRLAITQSVSCLPLLKHTFAYERRYLKRKPICIHCFTQILRYSPPLFAWEALNELKSWLAQSTKKDRSSKPDLEQQVHLCQRRLRLAINMWSAIKNNVSYSTNANSTKTAEEIERVWLGMNLVAPNPDPAGCKYMIVTDTTRNAIGKCSACGATSKAPYDSFLVPFACSNCNEQCPFVILRRNA